VSVDSEISPELVRQLLLEACLNCRAVLKDPLPTVRLSEISTQPFKYTVYVHFADYPSHFSASGELFSTIRTYLSQSGISPSTVRYEIATREAPTPEIRELSLNEHLRGVPLLRPLSDEEIQKLASTCQIKRFSAGEMLVQEGSVDNSLFVISSGIVSVLKADGGGHHVEVTRLGHSECFGEMALLTGEPRYATAQAITPVEVIQVPKEGLAPLLERRSELSTELAEIMAQRRARTDGFMESLSAAPPSGSMAAYAKEILGKIRSFFSLDSPKKIY
jgi:CRP-like cAMP-binding protein